MSKFVFDGPNKMIYLLSPYTEFDAVELYSEWKRWVVENEDARKYEQAMRSLGMDQITPTKFIAPFIELLNGWKIKPWSGNYILTVRGNLFATGGESPFIQADSGTVIVVMEVTGNAFAVQGGSGGVPSGTFPTVEEIVMGVWSENLTNYNTPNTAGWLLKAINEQTSKLVFDEDGYIKANIQQRSLENINNYLSSIHGSGNWEGAEVSGVIVNPEDIWNYPNRTLTSLAGQPAIDIDNRLSATHGAGSWEGISGIFPSGWFPGGSGILSLFILSTIPPASYVVDHVYGEIIDDTVVVSSGINVIFNYAVNEHSVSDKVRVIKSHVYYYDNSLVDININVIDNKLIITNSPSGFVFDAGYLYEVRLSAGISSTVSGIYPMQSDYNFYLLPYDESFDVNASVIKIGLSAFAKDYSDFIIMLMYIRNLYRLYENIKAVKSNIKMEQLVQLAVCMTRYTIVIETLSRYLDSTNASVIKKKLGDFTVVRSVINRIDRAMAPIIDSIIECIEDEVAGLGLSIATVVPKEDDERFPQKLRTQFFNGTELNGNNS